MKIKLADKEKIKVNDSDDVYGIMQRILLRENKIDREKEHFWILGMNLTMTILYIELVSMGSVKAVPVEPMNVYRLAVQKGATRVIAIHNHPGNSMKPSDDDKDITDRLIQVGKILGIRMEDHLIISPNTYMSFKNIGLMEQLDKSIKYIPSFLLIDQIREEERKIREEAVKTERKIREEAVKEAVKEALKTERLIRVESIMAIEKEKKAEKVLRKEAEKKLKTAVCKLMEKNMTVEQIAEILGISSDDVKQISKKNKG